MTAKTKARRLGAFGWGTTHSLTVKVNTGNLGAWAWCPTCCYLGPIRPTPQEASEDAARHADAAAKLDQESD
jgi:hypothetical protein